MVSVPWLATGQMCRRRDRDRLGPGASLGPGTSLGPGAHVGVGASPGIGAPDRGHVHKITSLTVVRFWLPVGAEVQPIQRSAKVDAPGCVNAAGKQQQEHN